MKVYRVKGDVNRFQSLLSEESSWIDFILSIDGRPKAATWKPPEFYSLHPLYERGDFWDIGTNLLAVSERTLPVVRSFFEAAGELLRFRFEGETLTALNITECINVLDADRTQWLLGPQGKRVLPLEYAFHPSRFTESSLFKIPETARGEVLVLEREGDPEEEFKAAVDAHGLRGLIFEELWDSER